MDPEGMAMMIKRHLESMEIRNYSKHSIKGRESDLGAFKSWCEDRGIDKASELTRPMIERYQRWLFHYRKKDGQPLKFKSQAKRLISIREFLKWMVRQHYLPFNPAAEIELPRSSESLPQAILSPSEIDTILNHINIDEPLGLRDRAMIETLYSTGVRRFELLNFQLYDLEVEQGFLIVRQGKGKRDRIVPIADRALSWLVKYMEEERPTLLFDFQEKHIFLSQEGQAITPNHLTYIARERIKQGGITKPGSCHLFRHSMASHMLDNGADIRHIQEILGHKHISSTQIYTRVSILKLKEVHQRTHPTNLSRTKQSNNDWDKAEKDLWKALRQEEKEDKE